MKRFNKKGFTIVELVIVIAVIGILAGVLIPTFSSITQKAQQSAALQEATAGRNAVLALTNGTMLDDSKFYVGDVDKTDVFTTKFVFTYANGAMSNVEFKDTLPKPTTYANQDFYACYINDVTAKALNQSSNYVKSIVDIIGLADGQTFVFENAANAEFYTISLKTGETVNAVIRIYWSSDIKDTLIMFMGDGEAA